MARQFVLYLVFAGFAAATNLGLRWLLSHAGLAFWIAVAAAYLAGMVVNFSLNKYLNFRSTERRASAQARTFVVVALGGLVLTEALSQLALRLLADVALPVSAEDGAHVGAVGAVVVYSFLAHRYLTFRQGLRKGLGKFWTDRASHPPST